MLALTKAGAVIIEHEVRGYSSHQRFTREDGDACGKNRA